MVTATYKISDQNFGEFIMPRLLIPLLLAKLSVLSPGALALHEACASLLPKLSAFKEIKQIAG